MIRFVERPLFRFPHRFFAGCVPKGRFPFNHMCEAGSSNQIEEFFGSH